MLSGLLAFAVASGKVQPLRHSPQVRRPRRVQSGRATRSRALRSVFVATLLVAGARPGTEGCPPPGLRCRPRL